MPLRFNTDRALFVAFPTARAEVGVEPKDLDPPSVARELVGAGKLNEAMTLCAYLLSRREAVVWGCRSLRSFQSDTRGMTTPCLKAAEDWIARSSEANQAAAREAGEAGSVDEASTWMARAAGWSGGMLGPYLPAPVPPHLTAVGVSVGLRLALHYLRPEDRLARGRACVEDALRLAEHGA